MKRSLTPKLVVAFLLVSVASIVLSAFFFRQATLRAFDRLLVGQAQAHFAEYAADYYAARGSWDGLMMVLRQHGGMTPRAPLVDMRVAFALADAEGVIIVPAGPYRYGARVPQALLARGTPVEVDGQVVGVILPVDAPPMMTPLEQRYLRSINQTLLYAALGASVFALALGTLLARQLTHPLRELTAAIRAMTRGQLNQQVPVRSEDELGELATAFNQLSRDLARANAQRRQMTADIAHDLRTPLTVITGYLESLRDGVLQPTPARFETMHVEALHLQRLVEDLRTLSLADAGELHLNRLAQSPGELLTRLHAAYQHQAAQREIVMRVDARPALPDINVDPDRMMQVLGNLMSNALRHTPPGGEIVLGAARRGDAVALTVRDTGAGIPSADLPHIFDRFYRSDAARHITEGESGLGLAIARALVKLHGGDIIAANAPEAGAIFTVTLPIAE